MSVEHLSATPEPRSRRNSLLTKLSPRNSTSCIKPTDVAYLRSEIDKELQNGLKSDEEYFRAQQREKQQAEFQAILDSMKK